MEMAVSVVFTMKEVMKDLLIGVSGGDLVEEAVLLEGLHHLGPRLPQQQHRAQDVDRRLARPHQLRQVLQGKEGA